MDILKEYENLKRDCELGNFHLPRPPKDHDYTYTGRLQYISLLSSHRERLKSSLLNRKRYGLKGCPFCGSSNVNTVSKSRYENEMVYTHYIQCGQCGVSTPTITSVSSENKGISLSELSKIWNRRV